jgi:hypothetical protein
MDETGLGSCPMAGFGISGAEPSDSATIVSYGNLQNKVEPGIFTSIWVLVSATLFIPPVSQCN